MSDPEARHQRLERLKFIERLVLLPLLLIAAGAFFTIGRAQVVGVSMMPTLQPGQRLTILKKWRPFAPLKEGDIVVIGTREGKKSRDEEVVKRIVFIQDEAGARSWPEQLVTPSGTYRTADIFARSSAPLNTRGGIYVLGDNINNSTDSRDFGAIYESEIIGKVIR